MGSLYGEPVVELAIAEAESKYHCESNKWNKYADVLDSIEPDGYYVGCGKKQYLDYCTSFINYLMLVNTVYPSNDPYTARYMQYQSDSCNLSAVVSYMQAYYANNQAYYTRSKDLERGDVVFFQNSKGFSHVGLCVAWDDSTFTTSEANVGGGYTDFREYKLSDIGAGGYVAGFGRPRYDGWSEGSNNNPTPTPTPEPTPTTKYYRVKTDSGDALRVREYPNSNSDLIGFINCDKVIGITAIVEGEDVDGVNTWAKTSDGFRYYPDYVEGFVSMRYLEEV